MLSDVEVDQRSPTVLDEEEHVQSLERQCVDSEEVTSPLLRSVIAKERPPSLRGRPLTRLQSIPRNPLSANFEAQGAEIASDSSRAPKAGSPLPREESAPAALPRSEGTQEDGVGF